MRFRALLYAIRELKYEGIGTFKENYRNRLIVLLINNTHIHSAVYHAVMEKMNNR